ncbi:MAG: tRNA glutamyl-Q(34) synthetase GluQRS [Planctomycetes bacterium]|nr:tRNA glutamyl-Q(34) synthetase GluQRS [Planctomycetota bacterium]
MRQPQSALRGRLAPSPTGALHLGNVRSFALTWLAARAQQGWIELRIEDLDGPRVQPGAVDQVIDDLQWLRFDWDVGPRFQAGRIDDFRTALQQLITQGSVYPCVCSRRDVEAAASAPHAGDEGPVYPGTCRGRFASLEKARQASVDGRVAWRFAVPSGRTVRWHDHIAGPQSYEAAQQLGDFVVWKKDDTPAYQLAVTVDDGLMQINQVIRGDDLLPSAARQILLHEAFGQPIPEWWHLPLVLDVDGQRMAKRRGEDTLQSLRVDGLRASQVLRWIAQTSGIELLTEPQSLADLLPGFDLTHLPREPVHFAGAAALLADRG